MSTYGKRTYFQFRLNDNFSDLTPFYESRRTGGLLGCGSFVTCLYYVSIINCIKYVCAMELPALAVRVWASAVISECVSQVYCLAQKKVQKKELN